jgi:hypothetical protein
MEVTLKATGLKVEVYKHKERGTYVNSKDCTTEYKKEDLIIKQ